MMYYQIIIIIKMVIVALLRAMEDSYLGNIDNEWVLGVIPDVGQCEEGRQLREFRIAGSVLLQKQRESIHGIALVLQHQRFDGEMDLQLEMHQ